MSNLFLLLLAGSLPQALLDALENHPSVSAARRAVSTAELQFQLQEHQLLDPLWTANASHRNIETGGSFQSQISGGNSETTSSSTSISWLTRRGFTISLDLSDGRSETNSSFAGAQTDFSVSTGLNITYPLWREKRSAALSSLDQSALSTLDATLALESARQEAAFEVYSSFWNCKIAEERVAVQGGALEEARSRKLEVEALIRAGQSSPSELATHTSRLLELEAALLQSQIEVKQCLDNAALLLGRPIPPEWIEAVGALVFEIPPRRDALSVMRARIGVQQREIGIADALALDLSNFDLQLGYGLSGDAERHADALEGLENARWNVGLVWSKRLGVSDLSERSAFVALEGARLTFSQSEASASILENSLLDTLVLQEQLLLAAQAQTDASVVARDAVEARWRAGLAISLALFQAENSVHSAEVSELSALSALRIAQANLSRFRRALVQVP
ncbi:TolC family protein [bacterium]|nr:TolC family protein [bacterium]